MVAPFGKLEYLYVGTSDIRRDLAYYVDVLGASMVWHFRAFGSEVAALRLGDGPLYLLADHRRPPSTLPLFAVPDLRATRKALRARGWRSEGRPFEIPPGPCVLFRDPSGNEIGIFENVRPRAMEESYADGENPRAVRGP